LTATGDQSATATFSALHPALTSYSLGGVAGHFDGTIIAIDAYPAPASLSKAVATFTTTTGARVAVAGMPQESGVTPNDFSTTVPYVVTAPDNSTTTFSVSVTTVDNSALLSSPLTADWVHSIVTNGVSVFWTASGQGGGSLNSVPVGGGPVTKLTTWNGNGECLAVDSSDVFWLDSLGGVMKIAAGGGTPTTLASVGSIFWRGIAVNGNSVYWMDDSSIQRVSKSGGAVTTIVSGLIGTGSLVVTSSTVYFTSRASVSGTSSLLQSVSVDGGAVSTLSSGLGQVSSLAVDSSSIYWSEASGAIEKIPVGGGSVATLRLAGANLSAGGIALDTDFLYLQVPGPVSILKFPLVGGDPTTLIITGNGDQPHAIAVDATSVYFSDVYSVHKIAK
jgi:hypothetical protein